ncbi:hypothetical protein LXL04_023009 [Taraxacum kok-saghyz]
MCGRDCVSIGVVKHGRKYQSVGKTTGTPLTVKGGTARHTGGSIGFDEHRVRLVKTLRQNLEELQKELLGCEDH